MARAVERLLAAAARHLDRPLAAAALALIGIGLLALASASGANPARLGSQLLSVLIALGLMLACANVPPHFLQRIALPLYFGALALLVAVALAGEVVHGARRWLDLGVARVQPSELMKLALPLALAWYFERHESGLRLSHYAVAALMLAAPTVLIARQPDLGTALLIGASGFFVLFLAGLSWRILAGFAAGALAAAPLAWSVLHDYQRQRILTLLDPNADPLGAGYHTIQSTIAVGSGGLFGKGWLNGTQARLDFIPERTTDFIFAVFAEEFGLAGSLVLLALFLFVIARGLVIAAEAPTLFARLLAGALALTFFTYAFVNMGMVAGLLPVVGVPLPLISYGGSALVSICAGLGILMSIATHRKLVPA